jgi:hypothetical protein
MVNISRGNNTSNQSPFHSFQRESPQRKLLWIRRIHQAPDHSIISVHWDMDVLVLLQPLGELYDSMLFDKESPEGQAARANLHLSTTTITVYRIEGMPCTFAKRKIIDLIRDGLYFPSRSGVAIFFLIKCCCGSFPG